MSEPEGKSKAEKLFEKLSEPTKTPEITESDARQLLSHPAISKDVEERSGGSHLWIVTISDPVIVKFWGISMFNVVVHNKRVKPVYVSDILKYIDFKLQILAEVEKEKAQRGY